MVSLFQKDCSPPFDLWPYKFEERVTEIGRDRPSWHLCPASRTLPCRRTVVQFSGLFGDSFLGVKPLDDRVRAMYLHAKTQERRATATTAGEAVGLVEPDVAIIRPPDDQFR